MIIYIATSWKNRHAVELLTAMLVADEEIEVMSFVDYAGKEEVGINKSGPSHFEDWVYTEDAKDKFIFDTKWASESDLVVYISPAGTDAWAEVGVAWANKVPIIGLYAKGEQSGLMRHMVVWVEDYLELIEKIMKIKVLC